MSLGETKGKKALAILLIGIMLVMVGIVTYMALKVTGIIGNEETKEKQEVEQTLTAKDHVYKEATKEMLYGKWTGTSSVDKFEIDRELFDQYLSDVPYYKDKLFDAIGDKTEELFAIKGEANFTLDEKDWEIICKYGDFGEYNTSSDLFKDAYGNKVAFELKDGRFTIHLSEPFGEYGLFFDRRIEGQVYKENGILKIYGTLTDMISLNTKIIIMEGCNFTLDNHTAPAKEATPEATNNK